MGAITPEHRARRRFHNLAWHAVYHARTHEEADVIERVVHATRAGHIPLRDAHAALSALRRDQQAA